MNIKIFFLIAIVLLIGSGTYMRSNFAYDSIGMSDNFNKIIKNNNWLQDYYSNSLNFKLKKEDCKNCIQYDQAEVNKLMQKYYWGDMFF